MKADSINLDNIVRSVALISDTHIGSDYAPWPEEPIYTDTGKNLSGMASPAQLQLLKGWYSFVDTCDEFKVDTVIHLGDACQGCNPKEGGVDTVTPDMNYQVDAASAFLEPLVRDKLYYQFSGTRYHEALNYKIHDDLVAKLAPICKQATFYGKFANLHLRDTNKTLNLAHACTSALMYPSSSLDREITFTKVAIAEGKIPKPDYIIRGHLHKYIHLDYFDMHGLQLPAWQAWYPLGDKVRLYGRTQPDIGGVILLVDKDSRSFILHFTYKSPKVVDFVQDA